MANLIYLIGPSGCGKDSVLTEIKRANLPNVLVAHRYITRPLQGNHEQHIPLSNHDFEQRSRQGLFALSWEAHGLHYGVGIEIEFWLQKGFHVIVNGSRAQIDTVQNRYHSQLLPIYLDVSLTTLALRLQQRGREGSQDIKKRLVRAEYYQQKLPENIIHINNNGLLTQTVASFIAVLPCKKFVNPSHNHNVSD